MADVNQSQIQEASEEEVLNLVQEEHNVPISGNDHSDNQTEHHDAHNIHSNSNRAIVFVMSGLHTGAGCPVLSETKIGSDFDNDLILTDNDILKQHLILTPIENGLNYGIQITCKGDNLIVNGEILLTHEQTLLMQESFVVTLGTVNINVSIYKASKMSVAYKRYVNPQIRAIELLGQKSKKYVSPQVILSDIRNIILLAIAIIFMIGCIAYYITRPVPKKPLNSDTEKLYDIKTLNIKEKSNSMELHRQAKNDLIHVLAQYDLNARLDIIIKNNIIYVEGNINNYELQNWGKVLNWFDTTYSSDVNLIPLITVNNGARRTISFKAIVADGDIPYVVSWTGDRYKPGATLPGGWIIVKISDDGVVVKDAIDNRIFMVNHIRSQHGSEIPDFRE